MQFPYKLLTDKDQANARLRVDVAQTGFFAGREFRSYLRLNIAASGVLVLRAVSPIDFILFILRAAISSGELDVSSRIGGTPGGTFTTVPAFRTNSMSSIPQPPYTQQVILSSGGTLNLTGSTEISAFQVKANANTNQASSVGSVEQDERGIAAGTYYVVLTNLSATDAVHGIFDLRWEERP